MRKLSLRSVCNIGFLVGRSETSVWFDFRPVDKRCSDEWHLRDSIGNINQGVVSIGFTGSESPQTHQYATSTSPCSRLVESKSPSPSSAAACCHTTGGAGQFQSAPECVSDKGRKGQNRGRRLLDLARKLSSTKPFDGGEIAATLSAPLNSMSTAGRSRKVRCSTFPIAAFQNHQQSTNN